MLVHSEVLLYTHIYITKLKLEHLTCHKSTYIVIQQDTRI